MKNTVNIVNSLFTEEQKEEIDRWEREKIKKNQKNLSDFKKIEHIKRNQKKTNE